MGFTPHFHKIILATTAAAIQKEIFTAYSFGRSAGSGPSSFNIIPKFFKVVPVFHNNLLKDFHFKHVQLQLRVHLVSHECETQLVPGVKTF